MGVGAGDIKLIRVIPIISAAAYSTGHRLGATMTLLKAAPDDGFGLIIQSVMIADKDKQNAAIDLVFYNVSPTITSADRTTMNITDANLHGNVCGGAQITTYMDMSGNSYGFGNVLGAVAQAAAGGVDVYCQAIIRASATYTTTTALEFTFGVIQATGR